jgi:S-adenosylmethionine:tRNA ribosyltransferase-isomerase
MYQTVFATEPGSAEMPSAGRPFTPELVTRLVSRGVGIVPLVLHTGVASLESHEPPYEEYYRVPRHTAERVTATRRSGGRVIAVGTTVVRALETVTAADGTTVPGKAGPVSSSPGIGRCARCRGSFSGFHEPRATHLSMLAALCGRAHLDRAYAEARRLGYLWHEFGDSHLIVSG